MALSNHLRARPFKRPYGRHDNQFKARTRRQIVQSQSAQTNGDHDRSAELDRGDEIVQQLSIAKYALAVGDTEQAMDAIDAALTTSRGSLSDLAGADGPPDTPTYAGTLVRATPAASTTPAEDEPTA
jgi:hypothetical protein